MHDERIKVLIFIFLLVSAMSSFMVFYITYRRYYKYLKSSHHDKWWQLMSKDPIVDAAGEWIRWPAGSVYVLLSVFKMSETYNDIKIEIYKKTSVVSFVVFMTFFIFLLFESMIMPAT